jgi:hypothetical protein
MLLFRYFLIALVIYLLVRSFMRYSEEQKLRRAKDEEDLNEARKVSKSIGEYVDFEEIKKDNS